MPITQGLEGPEDFPMANFKAKYHRKTVCSFEKYELMADLAVTTVQTWVMRKGSKQDGLF